MITSSRTFIVSILILSVLLFSSAINKTDDMPEGIKIVTLGNDHVLGPTRPFDQGHASTIVRTNDNHFLIAWFGGTHEKHDDVAIWMSKGNLNKWSPPRKVAKIRDDAHWNPVLSRSSSGMITLFFKVGKTIDEWETWVITSTDDGETWSKPRELVAGDHGGRGPVRNKPIQLSNGTWLAGASNEKQGVWNAFVDRSEDEGKSWTSTSYLHVDRSVITGEGIIQPTLWESKPGQVHMFLRSSCGYVCRSDSKDYGKTWSAVYKTSLPNPNSGIDLTKLSNNHLALVYNLDNKNWGERSRLAIAISSDNGKSWPVSTEIEKGVDGDEFSYPAVISMHDTIAVTYTWKRQNIAVWLGKTE